MPTRNQRFFGLSFKLVKEGWQTNRNRYRLWTFSRRRLEWLHPLLIVGWVAHYTSLLKLHLPRDPLANSWIIRLPCLLVIIEMVADKVPAVDHINDLIQTVIRPATGAIAFVASGCFCFYGNLEIFKNSFRIV